MKIFAGLDRQGNRVFIYSSDTENPDPNGNPRKICRTKNGDYFAEFITCGLRAITFTFYLEILSKWQGSQGSSNAATDAGLNPAFDK